MYCRTRENFTTGTTNVDDVASHGDKNIMLTDKDGNISLVKFSDTITKLQDMINDLNETVKKNTLDGITQATALASLSDSAIKNDDKIKIMSSYNLFLNSCGRDNAAPCGTGHYVSANANNTPANNQWTIKKLSKS